VDPFDLDSFHPPQEISPDLARLEILVLCADESTGSAFLRMAQLIDQELEAPHDPYKEQLLTLARMKYTIGGHTLGARWGVGDALEILGRRHQRLQQVYVLTSDQILRIDWNAWLCLQHPETLWYAVHREGRVDFHVAKSPNWSMDRDELVPLLSGGQRIEELRTRLLTAQRQCLRLTRELDALLPPVLPVEPEKQEKIQEPPVSLFQHLREARED
jgi:hypothetical protein